MILIYTGAMTAVAVAKEDVEEKKGDALEVNKDDDHKQHIVEI